MEDNDSDNDLMRDKSIFEMEKSRRAKVQPNNSHADTTSVLRSQRTASSRPSKLSRSANNRSVLPTPLPVKIKAEPDQNQVIQESGPIPCTTSPFKTNSSRTPEPTILPNDFKTYPLPNQSPLQPPTTTSFKTANSSPSREEPTSSFHSVESAKRKLILDEDGPAAGKKSQSSESSPPIIEDLRTSQKSKRRIVRKSKLPQNSSMDCPRPSQLPSLAHADHSLESIQFPSSDEADKIESETPVFDRSIVENWLARNRTPSPILDELPDVDISNMSTEPCPNSTFTSNNGTTGIEDYVVPLAGNEKRVSKGKQLLPTSQVNLANKSTPRLSQKKSEVAKGQQSLPNYVTRKEIVEVTKKGVKSDITSEDCCQIIDEVTRVKAAVAWGPLMAKMKKRPDLRALSNPLDADQQPSYGCPFYKRITDTSFVVDAFSYGKIEGVTHYFLTHFHSDHYRGLNSSINKQVVCSRITGNLVKEFFRLKDSQLLVLELNTPVIINDAEVTAIDANHCPGAVMFLFRFPYGRSVLHVGDFRFQASMKECPVLNRHSLDEVYLDTTFCQEQYDFPKQRVVLTKAVNLSLEFCENRSNPLIVCGTYAIGKEKVFKEIAITLNCKIWANPRKTKYLQCIGDQQILQRLTNNRMEAKVHVVELGEINQRKLAKYLESLQGNFDGLLAFKPTGWEHEKNKRLCDVRPRQYGNVLLVGLPYSEHSSFNELKEFVKFFSPRKITPTVNVGNSEIRQKMQRLFNSWITNRLQS